MIQLALGIATRRRGRGAAPPAGARAPAMVTAPSLAGAGRIAAPVTLSPGGWTGTPAPQLVFEWRRDGAAIPGARGSVYVPTEADDAAALTCLVRAVNATGTAAAETAPLPIARAAPVAAGAIPDSTYILDSGAHVLNVLSFFQGSALRFSVSGEGVAVDPATGELSIATDTLRAGVTVTVTAHNSGGAADQAFRLTIAAEPAAPEAIAPLLLSPPALAGSGRLGEALVVTPGAWGGEPAPAVALQWLRDDAEIAGATGESYLPGPADDGRAISCRVTASNAAGELSAVPAPIRVTRPAPVLVDLLPDVVAVQGAAAVTVDAAAAFAGEGLAFAVAGAGAAIDPATGLVTVPTGTLRAGEAVTVSASNSGGAAEAGFLVTIEALALPPLLLAAPALAGPGKIGSEVAVQAGDWGGLPAPALSLQWLRDGAPIAGATAAAYVPGPADDRCALACRVTARNVAGSVAAETAALAVTYLAPVRTGELFDEVFDQGTGPETVATAQVFAGEALVFAAAGAGATIDPATGVLTIPTDAALAGETVTVTASNSGGAAEASLLVTVEDPALDPETGFPFALAAEAWSAREERKVAPEGRRVVDIAAEVAVPEGFELCLYSGPENGVTKANWRQAVQPGAPYTTGSSMKVGSVCHNLLFWRRLEDGAWAQASSAVVFEIAGLETVEPEPKEPGGRFPAADLVLAAASASLLRSTLEGLTSTAGWRTDANGLPYYVIELPSGNYGGFAWSGVRPGSAIDERTGATCNVYLRSQDRAGLGAVFDGRVDIVDAQNITFQFCKFDTTSLGYGNFLLRLSSTENCGAEYCHFDCGFSTAAAVDPKGYVKRARYMLDITQEVGSIGRFPRVYMCLFSGQATKGIYCRGNHNYLIAENVFENISSDSIMCSWGNDGRVLNNWLSRAAFPTHNGTEYDHMDGFQLEANPTVSGLQVIGNVYMVGAETGVPGVPHQGIFCSKTNASGWTYRHNIVMCNSSHGITQTGTDVSGHIVEYNTVLRTIDQPGKLYSTHYQVPGAAQTRKNVQTKTSGGAWGDAGLNIGVTQTDRSAIDRYYGSARLGASFYDLRPVPGAATHWDHADPVGAFQRFHDVIVLGKYPKIGPAAAAWKRWYDPKNRIAS